METLDAKLTRILRERGAVDNAFFRRCRQGLSDEKRRQLISNFYPITETFALSSFAYCDNIARRIANERPDDDVIPVERLEEFLAKVIEVTTVEFNIGHVIAPDRYHFNAFCRLAPKLGMSVQQVKQRRYSVERETLALQTLLRRNFRDPDILPGLANIYSIETSALSIITALEHAFAGEQSTQQRAFYTDYELEHITLHKELEVEHDSEARELIELLDASPAIGSRLEREITKLASHFHNFWAKLAA